MLNNKKYATFLRIRRHNPRSADIRGEHFAFSSISSIYKAICPSLVLTLSTLSRHGMGHGNRWCHFVFRTIGAMWSLFKYCLRMPYTTCDAFPTTHNLVSYWLVCLAGGICFIFERIPLIRSRKKIVVTDLV